MARKKLKKRYFYFSCPLGTQFAYINELGEVWQQTGWDWGTASIYALDGYTEVSKEEYDNLREGK